MIYKKEIEKVALKIEIILYEEMAFQAVEKAGHHAYSDHLSDTTNAVPCYTLQEVLAEKVKSLDPIVPDSSNTSVFMQ